MAKHILLGAWTLFFTGCASTVAKIIPVGEPVTKESCEKLDLYDLGLKDGEVAKREGTRFDFWRSDCAALGVTIDKVKYTTGYHEGLAKYCSCEKGYVAGRKDEVRGLQGQYYACGKNEYVIFIKGFEAGQKKYDELSTEPQSVPPQKVPADDFSAEGKIFCTPEKSNE